MCERSNIERIELGNDELEMIAGRVWGLESTQALLQLTTAMSDTIQNLSAMTMAAVKRAP